MLNIKKIKPLFTKIVVTKDIYEYEKDFDGIITHQSGSVKEYQKVIAVGDAVRNINEGDLVCINPDRYAVRKYQENSLKKDLLNNKIVGYNIPTVKIDNKEYLIIDNNDVVYVVEDYEDKPNIVATCHKPIIV